MSERIKIPYRGYEITLSDNSGEWRCWDLGVENVDITKVKAAIDRIALKERKKEAVKALMLGWNGRVEEVTIIDYNGPIKDRKDGALTGEKVVVDHSVWVMKPGAYGKGMGRNKEKLSQIIRPGPHTDGLIAEIAEQEALEKAAREKAHQLRKRLPRLGVEDIAGLIKLSEEGETEA